MSTKNTNNNSKRKNSLFDSKNLIVLGIAAAVVILFAVIMTMLMPTEVQEEDNSGFDSSAWESSVREAESSVREAESMVEDSGLTSVYNEEAVATAGRAEEEAEPAAENAETPAEAEGNNTSGLSGQNASVITFTQPVSGAVTKDYSGDDLVYSETMNDWRTHNGIDFSAEEGTEVLAAADGTVEAITDNGMFGRTIVILHSGGLRTIYSNLAEGSEVAVGDNVLQGTPIGKVGSTATAEAAENPHLHFEVSLNEETISPHDYLPEAATAEE